MGGELPGLFGPTGSIQLPLEVLLQLQKRIATACEEMGRLSEFDYVVVNRDGGLDRAVDDVVAIIQAEHCCAQPRVVRL